MCLGQTTEERQRHDECSYVIVRDHAYELTVSDIAEESRGTINRITGELHTETQSYAYDETAVDHRRPDGSWTRSMVCVPTDRRF